MQLHSKSRFRRFPLAILLIRGDQTMRRLSVALLCVAVSVLFQTQAYSAIFHVSTLGNDSASCGSSGSPCATIWKAINNADASATNTIRVAQGTYADYINITASLTNLTIQGGWNNSFTSQNCSQTNTVVTNTTSTPLTIRADASESITATVQCLRISDQGHNQLRGISVSAGGSGASINFTLENSMVDSFLLSGIQFSVTNSANIATTITNSTVSNNQQPINTGHGGAGLRFGATTSGNLSVQMDKNRITNNISLSAGGGILFSTESLGHIGATMTNTIIADNSGSPGGGLLAQTYMDSGSTGDIDLSMTNNTITNNESEGLGGGIYLQSGANTISATLKNMIIWGNQGVGTGDDIYLSVAPFYGTVSGINIDYSIVGETEVVLGDYITGSHIYTADPGLNDSYALTSGSFAVNAGQCGRKFQKNIQYELLSVSMDKLE